MDELLPEGASPVPAVDDDEQHTRTLTDLLDELDCASFRRALAFRDSSYYATAVWRGRK